MLGSYLSVSDFQTLPELSDPCRARNCPCQLLSRIQPALSPDSHTSFRCVQVGFSFEVFIFAPHVSKNLLFFQALRFMVWFSQK